MLALSEELRQARAEIDTWVRLHQDPEDTDLGVWRALTVLTKVAAKLERDERSGR